MLLYKIAQKVYELEEKGHNVIKMNVGELDFPTPSKIIDAGLEALKSGKTSYGSAAGELALREEIARRHESDVENVIITPGSKWGLYATMELIAKNGKVVSFSPVWPTFESMAKHSNASFEGIELEMENNWKIDLDALSKSLNGKSIMILNNPCNPTSKAWDDKTQKRIVEISKEQGVPTVLDLAYRDLAFEKKEGLKWTDGMIICNSFSKSLAMTGWRIGYTVADKELIDRYMKLNQISITCVSKFIQSAALAGLKEKERITDGFRKECKKRADAAMEVFEDNGVECTRPDAGFYVFPKLPCKDSTDICMKLLKEHKIAIVPGSVFGDYPEHVRISLCYSPNIIADSISKLMSVVEKCE